MRVRTTLTGWSGGPGLCTNYFRGAGAVPTATEMAEGANRVRAFWNSAKGLYFTAWNAQVSGAIDLLDETTGRLTGGAGVTTPAVVVGSGLSTINDVASMPILQLNTAAVVQNRRVRGRMNLGPTDTGQTTAGGLSSGAITAFTAAANFFFVLVNVPITPVVWHRPVSHLGGSYADVTGFSLPTKLGVLRSRRD